MKQLLVFNNSSQGLLVLTSYLPSGDIKRTPFKGVLKEGYQSYISFKTEDGKYMKEAFDMKNLLSWESKFPKFFFLAICYISSLSGQINKS